MTAFGSTFSRPASGKKRDQVIAAGAIAIAVLIFVAQGPYDRAWKYMVVFVPIAIALLTIVALHTPRVVRSFQNRLSHAFRVFEEVSALRGTSTIVLQVGNPNGDATLKRWYRLEVAKEGATVAKTKKELLFSPIRLTTMPPAATLLDASRSGQQLTARLLDEEEGEIGGRRHFKYVWVYRLAQPMSGKGDFVEFSYAVHVAGAESDAFTKDGGLFSVQHGALELNVEATLIAPQRHSIELLDCCREDENGRKTSIPAGEWPTLKSDQHILVWRPSYKRSSCFVCRYRLVPY